MVGCFYDITTKAVFWSYVHNASKITIVGNDGYTFYTKEQLDSETQSQHCYGEGNTDGYTYLYCRKKDWDKYKSLRFLYKYGIKKFGFGFEIITPTIYEEFYNPKILNIEPDINQQKWIEPSIDEYEKLYVKSKKDRKLPKEHFFKYNG